MRVALIPTPDLRGNSGSMVYARAQAKELAVQGVDVHLVGAFVPPLDGVQIQSASVPLDHPIQEDLTLGPNPYAESIMQLVWALLEIYEGSRIDVVHGFYSTFTGYAATLFEALTGVPAVVSVFGRDVNPGMTSHPAGERLTRACLPVARRIIASNDATRRNALGVLGVSPERVVTIAMGVDEHRFGTALEVAAARRELGWREDAPAIVCVLSSMLPEKQADLVVEAIAPVVAARPPARLVLVGPDYDGGTGAADRVRALAKAAAPGTVVLAGRQSHDRIPLYIAAADAVVDGRRVHNFSSALMEALAIGRPVVASDSALAQLPGAEGMFPSFSDGDRDALAKHASMLLDDGGARERVAAAARVWWIRHRHNFALEQTTGALVTLYETVAAEVAGGPT